MDRKPERKPTRGPDKDPAELYRKVGLYTAIPTMMVVGPLLGYLGGAWLEKKVGYEPWLAFGGMVLGILASARQIAVVIRRGTRGPGDS